MPPLEDLRRKRHDLHVFPVTQLACDRTEDARTARVSLVVDDTHNIIFLKVYGSKTFEPLFYEVKNSIKESTDIEVELEKDVGSIVMFNL